MIIFEILTVLVVAVLAVTVIGVLGEHRSPWNIRSSDTRVDPCETCGMRRADNVTLTNGMSIREPGLVEPGDGFSISATFCPEHLPEEAHRA